MEKTVQPSSLMSSGDAFYDLYLSGIGKKTLEEPIEHINAGYYCLLIGLELYLKSYLAKIDSKYCEVNQLKNLGHDLSKVVNEIKKVDHEFGEEIEKELERIGIDKLNIPGLRYPEVGKQLVVHSDLLPKYIGFDPDDPDSLKNLQRIEPEPFKKIIEKCKSVK